MQAGREIKFRMWDFENQEMIDGDSLAFEEYAPIKHLLSRKGIMQFTGLRDKNGKEIYEGDIALIYGDRCVIEYDSKSASYVARTKIDSYWALDEETFKLGVEVIGNIYENPELLEVE